MTTDLINGVPRSLLAALATEADKYDDSSLCVINDNCELWQIGHIMPTVTVGHLRAIRALLATAQPAAEVIETDCRSEEGVTVGLIDALIAICRPLATRDLATPAACAALEDLRSDSDALAIFLGLPPAADGEREVWAVPVLDGEKKTTFYTEQLPFVPGIGVKQLGEPVRMVEARAAKPQQSVAVTDEVRRLREALERVKLTEKEARHHSVSTVAYWNNAVTACISVLAAQGGEVGK